MSNPTAVMLFMFSDRLQKMRDVVGTAYGDAECPVDAFDSFLFFPFFIPFLSASILSVHDGTSSGRGSDNELTCVTCRGFPEIVLYSLTPKPSPKLPDEKHAL